MSERHLPDWDDNQLSLGKPACMSTPTLIEWIQRELETPEETTRRHEAMAKMHELWHVQNPGIYACCIKTGGLSLNVPFITVNERRLCEADIEVVKERFHTASKQSKTMVLPEGVNVTYHNLY